MENQRIYKEEEVLKEPEFDELMDFVNRVLFFSLSPLKIIASHLNLFPDHGNLSLNKN